MKTRPVSVWIKAATVIFCSATIAIMTLSLLACARHDDGMGRLYLGVQEVVK